MNLYPFSQTIERPGATDAEAIENIDVGGPALLRAAAKNHAHVLPVVDPADYPAVLTGLQVGRAGPARRRRFAAKAFQHTASYDTAVAGYLRDESEELPAETDDRAREEGRPQVRREPPPARRALRPGAQLATGADARRGHADLRQAAVVHGHARRRRRPRLRARLRRADGRRRQARGALRPRLWREPGGHLQPRSPRRSAVRRRRMRRLQPPPRRGHCPTRRRNILRGHRGSRPTPMPLRRSSRSGSPDVRLYRGRSQPAGRLCPASEPNPATRPQAHLAGASSYRRQTFSARTRSATGPPALREPTLEELVNMLFSWRVVKHVRSTAVVLARQLHVVGVGAGQPSRDDAARIAVRKAGDRGGGRGDGLRRLVPQPGGRRARRRRRDHRRDPARRLRAQRRHPSGRGPPPHRRHPDDRRHFRH